MAYRKVKLDLPDDCEKLDVSICEHPKIQNKCKIHVARFSGKTKCVANENYLVEQELQKEGFKNFAKIDPDNLEEELSLRDRLCRQLSPEYCKTQKAKMLGCDLSKGIFKKSHCKLSQRVIDYYYAKKNTCIMPDCNEVRERYNTLCTEHYIEFNNMLELLIQAYEDLTKHHEDDTGSLEKFEEIYLYLKDYYGVYLLEKTATLVKIEEMAMNIRNINGYGMCQCYNISECIGSGEKGDQCKNKMIKNNLGYVCATHKKCISVRLTEYKNLRDNFNVICKKESCASNLARAKELYSMIKFSTEGEISKIKNEIYEMIIIIEQYLKEIN